MPETKLVIILPDDPDRIEQIGSILVQRGDTASIYRFTYASGQGVLRLAHVLPEAAQRLTQMEQAPPPLADTSTQPTKPAPSTSTAPDDDTPDWLKPQWGSKKKSAKKASR